MSPAYSDCFNERWRIQQAGELPEHEGFHFGPVRRVEHSGVIDRQTMKCERCGVVWQTREAKS